MSQGRQRVLADSLPPDQIKRAANLRSMEVAYMRQPISPTILSRTMKMFKLLMFEGMLLASNLLEARTRLRSWRICFQFSQAKHTNFAYLLVTFEKDWKQSS